MSSTNKKSFLIAAALTVAVAGATTYAAPNETAQITDLDESGYTLEWEEGKSPRLWLSENLSEEDQALMQELHEQVKKGDLNKEEMREKMQEADIEMPRANFHRHGMMHFKGDLTQEQQTLLEDIKTRVDAGELSWEEAQAELEAAGLPTPGHNMDFIENLTEEERSIFEELHGLKIAGEITHQELKERLEVAGIELPERPFHPPMRFFGAELTEEQREALKDVRGDHEAMRALLETFGVQVPEFEPPFELEIEEEIELKDVES